ncbi:TonB-dependent receptor [Opitutales bacterium ASA1]|uniref:TonB-dependent siderophore receptor n=1 Tax=Congregicoccus parvus TaxID=3081749 RepID=UPI002B2985DF|nr:TonB-dependent receptor [Opitutales bacterium ASA1]
MPSRFRQASIHRPDRSGRFILTGAAAALFALADLEAQTAAGDVVELEELVTTAEAADIYDVLPSRETASVFGTSRNPIETPRSLTMIESSLVDLFGIRSVNDFVAMTAGSFTGNYFGVAGALDVRGERADNFFRGFRRIENRGNFPTPIASTDFVEIVKGPPPPVYGGGKVGGILNFIPKTAKSKTAKFIDRPTGVITATVGSYSKLSGSIEYGLPFSIGGKDSGAYFFVQGEDSEHYYDGIYNKNLLVQLAVDTQLTDTVLLEYGFMAQWADLNQSLGWNRVTQELIDSKGGRYLAGRAALDLDANGDGFLSPAEVGPYALEQFAFASPFPYDALTANQQAAFALDPSTVRYVSIDHHTVQAEAIDFSKTDAFTAYFDVTKDVGLNLVLKNQTFYDSMNHTKYSSYGFTADYVAMALENKTTAVLKLEPSDNLLLDTMFGFSWRWSDGDERESRGRGYQVLDRRDISAGATGNDRFEGAHTGTGAVPYNWRQEGDFTDLGVFALVDGRVSEKLGFVVSGRWDSYEADTVGTNTSAVFGQADARDDAFTYNASLTYQLPGGVNAYLTHAESSYLELGQGGMIAKDLVADGTWLQDSKLTEIGLKGSLLDRRLYATVAWYEQEKSSYNTQAGAYDFYRSKGLEVEARYAPNRSLSFTAAATWQKSELLNPPFFLGIPPEVLGLDPALVYGGRFVGLGTTLGVSAPVDAPTPERVFSLNATYTAPRGWGLSLGGTYVSSFFSGYAQAVTLPSYFVTRAAAFYNTGPWSFRLNANNLFDEKYYNPQFLFWDVFVSPSVGPTAELTVSYRW